MGLDCMEKNEKGKTWVQTEVEDDSIFYGEFPALDDFPCISSSSSSTIPFGSIVKVEDAGLKKSQPLEEVLLGSSENLHFEEQAIDGLEEIREMDLIWNDPSSGNPQEREANVECPSDDLAMVFFEWLKCNKESISPADLRSIKLKRSTIESAARQLGGGKEGMKQLLKLILAWVQNHHLQRKRNNKQEEYISVHDTHFHASNLCPNPHLPYIVDSTTIPSSSSSSFSSFPHYPMMIGFLRDYATASSSSSSCPPLFNNSSTQMMDSSVSWPQHFPAYPPPSPCFGNKYTRTGLPFQGLGEPLIKMAPSATKEARKKRMARQRRFISLHHHHHRHHHHHHQQPRTNTNCSTVSLNWVMLQSVSASSSTLVSSDVAASDQTSAIQPPQRQITSSERRQEWKPEKNFRFLLQKVLKQSDVGNLGRIVLPKKEAEMHLPELEARDGITIAMEDIGTSRVWNMRYRFWPNNKSRMYILENTGDFVRTNGLQEGDFIVIYIDSRCGKYMIRGVKVRKQELKSEGKGSARMQRISSSNAASEGDGSSSAFCNQ